jgi:Carboxypeptidase regulatory-like domain/TonB-dependent Receptor Plug Domain/TonB dependent receptor
MRKVCVKSECDHTDWPDSPRICARVRPGTSFANETLTRLLSACLQISIWAILGATRCLSQTASTGALIGEVLDPSGKGIAHASVEAKNKDMAASRFTVSDDEGRFVLPLVTPGTYQVRAATSGYSQEQSILVNVPVTETIRLSIPMKVAGVTETISVQANVSQLQDDSIALGSVVQGQTIQDLPLASRNFTQIVNLSPGVLTGVNNAGELGVGSGGLSQIDPGNDGTFVHGSRSYDNGYEFDGVPVNDLQGSSNASGGIPIPSPDAIEQFKVQTGLYDVSFGEHAGASVSLVTKSGTNNFHGSLFEYFRNDVLNANDYFLNLAGQPRADLKQNQFGATIGGPIRHDRLFYFGSYQGTRQSNGLAANQARIACSASFVMPPLTSDRSAPALGGLFAGSRGAFGGVAIKGDGSNINPVALEILNFKLPNGSYLIPSPQVVDASKPVAIQGLNALSAPCHFDDDQVLANVDVNLPHNDSLALRFIGSNGTMNVSLPGNGLNGTGNIPGFPSNIDNRFRVASASWVRPMRAALLNELRFAYTSTLGSTSAQAPFHWSDFGVPIGSMNNEDGLPSLGIVGSINLASAFPRTFDQKRFYLSDMLSYSHGRHLLQMGGSLSRLYDDVSIVGLGSLAEFLSWPDFLLGLNAEQNGTNLFSNVYGSVDDYGLLDREYRRWNGSVFIGDHFRATSTLNVDFGLRYQRIGQFNDALGRGSSFDASQADPTPPATGSVAGYVVGANYQGMTPAGVIRAGNDAATFGLGENYVVPRAGVAWKPSSSLVVRAGYGIYLSQPTGQAFFQSVFGAPFAFGRQNLGQSNAAATFSAPFAQPFPTPDFFPYFPPYSPTTNVSIGTASPDFRPAIVQQYGANIQLALARNWTLELGNVNARSTHLLRSRSLNQALWASPSNPIRGAVSNTVANVGLRVPVPGIPPDSLDLVESEGTSSFNDLEVSLSKRLSRGLQFLSSYTFSKTLDSDPANVNGSSAGNTLTRGDQNSAPQRRGRASFDRTHRFILSGLYSFPSPSEPLARVLFGGWTSSWVVTVQSGTALTIAYNNLANVFGISEDRAQLQPQCDKSNVVRPGSVQSKQGNYFNTSCLTTPPVIGDDGIGTAFGNSEAGIGNGPGQSNVDLGVMRSTALTHGHEPINLVFRAEFFNLLNHPQFSNPNATYGSASFGSITSTSVNPRVGQLALKLVF